LQEVIINTSLNHVSYCADDKEDKRMFCFIAKNRDGQHYCYGLESANEVRFMT